MVLRGSKTSPDKVEFGSIKSSLREAIESLESAESNLAEQKLQIPAAFSPDTENYLTKTEFSQHLKLMNERLALLDQKIAAEKNLKRVYSKRDRTRKQLFCGGVAGVLSRTMVAPIDRVKILLQTQAVAAGMSPDKYGGVAGTVRKVVKEEGVQMLWRGNAPNCIRIFPYASLQFWSYDYYKGIILQNQKNTKFGVLERFKAGVLAGITAASLTYPLDLIRIRLATNTDPAVSGFVSQGRSIMQEGGVLALYTGFIPTLTSLSPFIAINFTIFDTIKTNFSPEKVNSEFVNALYILGFGASSAVIAQSICYPLDTVRRRMQVKGSEYGTMRNAYATIMKNEGFRGFYGGILPNTIKIIPNNAMRWLFYTYLCRMLGVEQRS